MQGWLFNNVEGFRVIPLSSPVWYRSNKIKMLIVRYTAVHRTNNAMEGTCNQYQNAACPQQLHWGAVRSKYCSCNYSRSIHFTEAHNVGNAINHVLLVVIRIRNAFPATIVMISCTMQLPIAIFNWQLELCNTQFAIQCGRLEINSIRLLIAPGNDTFPECLAKPRRFSVKGFAESNPSLHNFLREP